MELFSRNLRKDFFLKIGILSAKLYTKKVPNIEQCNFIPAPLRTLSTKQVCKLISASVGTSIIVTPVRKCFEFGHRWLFRLGKLYKRCNIFQTNPLNSYNPDFGLEFLHLGQKISNFVFFIVLINCTGREIATNECFYHRACVTRVIRERDICERVWYFPLKEFSRDWSFSKCPNYNESCLLCIITIFKV